MIFNICLVIFLCFYHCPRVLFSLLLHIEKHLDMITGEIKNKIDQIWDTFFVAGITNPITVLEQMTYIFFMKMLDDKQLQEEENARDWDGEVENPTFPAGQLWINPEAVSDEERAGVPYENLRWHVFKNFGSDNMFKIVRQSVFEFIKHIGTGEESAYSRYMKSAIFLVATISIEPTPSQIATLVLTTKTNDVQ